jgi:hypothetical protein
MTSLSKNQEQLGATIKELAPKKDPHDEENILNYDEAVVPDGNAWEIKIPDDSAFAEMVNFRTVFLDNDEMDILDCFPSAE